MAIFDRLLGRSAKSIPEVDLAPLLACMTASLARQTERHAEPGLVRARLADRLRDKGVLPLVPEAFDTLATGLDAEVWGRLALLVGLLDEDAARDVLPAAGAEKRSVEEFVAAGLIGVARDTPLLTLELLRQSALRVEELTRRFLAALGVGVQGESAKVSRQRLIRLDYARLLAEAESAREAAAERTEKLRKLQDEQEARRPRRGKW